ncbi:MAG: type II toxin-antitoxin system HicA family toxin [Gammaproteobacteria bacterium]|nr:type II toxin-antitoxin system HicA family toxin [Gammaproteobacteria bacterium]
MVWQSPKSALKHCLSPCERAASRLRPSVYGASLGKIGCYRKRQHGSHIILRRDHPFAQLVVPDHKELDRGTLRAILRQANLGVDDFIKLL